MELMSYEIINYLWEEDHAIFKQCAHTPYTPGDEDNPSNKELNIDGFGIGYYVQCYQPYIYRNSQLPWNDPNIKQLIEMMSTNTLVAHIRATHTIGDDMLSPVHTYNCHPFSWSNFIFCHNGVIETFYKGAGRKTIVNSIDDDLLIEIKGNTDSEYMFYLIMTMMLRGINLEESVREAIYLMINISGDLKVVANFMITDGSTTVVSRYSNTVPPPSLYYCHDEGLTMVASEPIIKNCSNWTLMNPNSILVIENGSIDIRSI